MNRLRCNCRRMARSLPESTTLPRSTRFGAGEFYDLAPLLDFARQESAEICGGARKDGAAQVSEARPHLGIVDRCIDLPVELVDDFCRRVLGHADAIQAARLITRNELA